MYRSAPAQRAIFLKTAFSFPELLFMKAWSIIELHRLAV
jgi:hypothetical protein